MSRYALPHTLPDYFTHRPRLLVVGLNPASYAVQVGHYYARRSNRFWRLLVESGLAPGPLVREDDHRLPSLGIALTDLCKRPTPNVDDITADEFRAGRIRLARIARRIEPGVIAFNGLAGYRMAYDAHAVVGLQPLTIAGRPVFVLPSSSARAGGTLSFDALLAHWFALRAHVDAHFAKSALGSTTSTSSGRSPRSSPVIRRSASSVPRGGTPG